MKDGVLLERRPSCATCGTEGAVESLKKCAGCRSVLYCDQDCQREAWKTGHREVCGRLAALRAQKNRDKRQLKRLASLDARCPSGRATLVFYESAMKIASAAAACAEMPSVRESGEDKVQRLEAELAHKDDDIAHVRAELAQTRAELQEAAATEARVAALEARVDAERDQQLSVRAAFAEKVAQNADTIARLEAELGAAREAKCAAERRGLVLEEMFFAEAALNNP